MAFEYLKQYATFQSVEEMDQHVEQHIQAYYFDLTDSERAIVFALSSRSLMYPGASHLKAETIAEQVGISRSTVMRAIKKLTQLNIIEKIKQTKLNGIKGASIYKILPYNDTSIVKHREISNKASNYAVSEEVLENQSLDSFNLLKQAHKNNKLIEYVEEQPVSEDSKERKIKQYGNKYQQALYDFIHMMPFGESILNAAYEISLAIQMSSKEDFILAKDTIKKVAMDMMSHLRISSTVRGVVAAAYNNAKNRRDSGLNIARYNWLLNKNDVVDSTCNIPTMDIRVYNWI